MGQGIIQPHVSFYALMTSKSCNKILQQDESHHHISIYRTAYNIGFSPGRYEQHSIRKYIVNNKEHGDY